MDEEESLISLAKMAELFERQFAEVCGDEAGPASTGSSLVGRGHAEGSGREEEAPSHKYTDDKGDKGVEDRGSKEEDELDILREMAEEFERVYHQVCAGGGPDDGDSSHDDPGSARPPLTTTAKHPPGEEQTGREQAAHQRGPAKEDGFVGAVPGRFIGAISHDLVRIEGEPRRRKGTAVRKIKRGECVLFEEPIVTVRTGQGLPDGAPPCDEVEWAVAHGLLEMGCRSGWASEYCAERLSDREENEPVLAWMEQATGASRSEVVQVYRVVTNNALSLETMCMRISYGAGFFGKAAMINHSCDPNCLSLRMGGNMAIFAQREIEEGEELTHSYISSHLLMQDGERRGRHLFFRCACLRCSGEGQEEAEALASLHLPGHFASSPDGLRVARFMASVVEGPDEAVWDQGVSLLAGGQAGEVIDEVLGLRPLAGVELVDAWLQSLWGMLLSGGKAEAQSARQAGDRWVSSVRGLVKGVESAGRGKWGDAARRHLMSTALVLGYVLKGNVGEDECADAMCELGRMYGKSLDCFREDFSCMGGMLRGNFRSIGEVAQLAAARLSGEA